MTKEVKELCIEVINAEKADKIASNRLGTRRSKLNAMIGSNPALASEVVGLLRKLRVPK